jgi:hypothetical protein
MFYRLVSDNIIQNTFSVYKNLIQALGAARHKKPYEKGYISPLAFADDTRHIEDIRDSFLTPQEYIEYHINRLRNARENYHSYGYLNKWYNQDGGSENLEDHIHDSVCVHSSFSPPSLL